MMKDEDSKPSNNSSEDKDKPASEEKPTKKEKSTTEKVNHSFNDEKPAVH
jgi:hypothetical protein